MSSATRRARLLEPCHHFLYLMFVLADQNVNVIRHDRAGVAGVAFAFDHLGKSGPDLRAGFLIEGEQGKTEDFGSAFVKRAYLPPRRLTAFTPLMEFAQFGNEVAVDLL